MLTAALALGPATGAAASPATPDPSPSAEPALLEIAPSAPGAATLDADVAVTLTLAGGAAGTDEHTATVRVGTEPLRDAAALEGWIEDARAPGALEALDRIDLAGADADAREDTEVIVPEDALGDRGPGVYPLSATAPDLPTARSVLVLHDAGAATPALVVAITAGARSTGVIPGADLATLTGPDGHLTALLDAVEGTGATLAVDPAIVASIRVLEASAPPTATAWLERLTALPNPRFALQYADADVTAQAAAGAAALLAPTSFAYALPSATDEPGGETEPETNDTETTGTGANGSEPSSTGSAATADPAATPDPSATPDPDASTAPVDTEALTAIPGAAGTASRSPVLWPAQGFATASLLPRLAELAPGAVTLLSSDALAAPAPPGGGSAAGTEVATYSADTADALAAAAVADPETAPAARAELAARAYFDGAGIDGGALVAFDRADPTVPLPALRDALLTLTARGPAATLSSLRDDRPLTVRDEAPVGVVSAGDRAAAFTELTAEDEALAAMAGALVDPGLLTGRERAVHLQLLGASWATDASAWDAAVDAYADRRMDTLQAISIRPLTTVQLLGSEASIPVFIENGLPWPARVVLEADVDNLRIDVEERRELIAEAGVNTPERLPVSARVGRGSVTLSLVLTTPDGAQLGPERTADVVVRAEWETIGLATLGTIVALLLVVGLVRTLRRRRRAAGDPADEATGDATTDAAAEASPERNTTEHHG